MAAQLNRIHTLREKREKDALNELQNLIAVRDKAISTMQAYETRLAQEQAAQRNQEQLLQNKALETTLTVSALETIVHKMEVKQAEVNEISAYTQRARQQAENATNTAEHGRKKYAHLLRSKKKWEEVIDREEQKNTTEAVQREELVQEDASRPRAGARL